jgi:hypothetical protein
MLQQLLLHMQLSAGGAAAARLPPPARAAATGGRTSYRQASQLLSALLRYDAMAGRAPLPEGEAEGSPAGAVADVSPFSAAFEQELHRAKRFIAEAYERVWGRVDRLCDCCEPAETADAAPVDCEAMQQQCGQLGARLRGPC